MNNPKDFAEKIKAIDTDFFKSISKASLSQLPYSEALLIYRTTWKPHLKAAFEEAMPDITASPEIFLKEFAKAYKAYISPLFTSYLKSSTYKYSEANENLKLTGFKFSWPENVYKKFKSALHNAKSPKAIEDIIETYLQEYPGEEGFDYYLRSRFTPRHPVYHWLHKAISTAETKETRSYDIHTDKVFSGLLEYITFPQNKSVQDVAFALAIATGESVPFVFDIKPDDITVLDVTSIQLKKREKPTLLLCTARDFIRAVQYLDGQRKITARDNNGTKKKRAESTVTTTRRDTSRRVLRIENYLAKFNPALHKELAAFLHSKTFEKKHFQDIKSIASFVVQGPDDLPGIIAGFKETKDAHLQKLLENRHENVVKGLNAVLEEIEAEPRLKLGVVTIREVCARKGISCSNPTAMEINSLLKQPAGDSQ